jgi:O-antigen ligase
MYERTRGSGLFLQPNVAGAAIALLYALVIPRVSGNLAFIATIVAFLAILLTFSRSGMAVFIIIFIFGIWCKYLPRYTLPVITILILFLLATTSVLYFISDVFNIDQGSGFNRLFNTSEFLGSDAFVSGDRFYILLDALGLYFESAILGNGIGYSWYFAESNLFQQGTHNLYLRYMLEYGTIGLFIWPLFLYALYRIRHKGVGTKWAIGVSISAMVAALFSHNIPEQGVILAPLMACFLFPIKPVNR